MICFNSKIKRIVPALLAAVLVLCIAGCAAPPTEKVTTATEYHKVVDRFVTQTQTEKQMEASAKKSSDSKETKPVSQADTQPENGKESDVEFSLNSYYKYGENYASISNIQIDNSDITVNAKCSADVKMIYIGERSKNMLIGIKAYNAKDEIVRDTYILIPLKGVRNGKTVENIRFDIPYEAVRVEFFDYVKS